MKNYIKYSVKQTAFLITRAQNFNKWNTVSKTTPWDDPENGVETVLKNLPLMLYKFTQSGVLNGQMPHILWLL
jgi:hypothetical protein